MPPSRDPPSRPGPPNRTTPGRDRHRRPGPWARDVVRHQRVRAERAERGRVRPRRPVDRRRQRTAEVQRRWELRGGPERVGVRGHVRVGAEQAGRVERAGPSSPSRSSSPAAQSWCSLTSASGANGSPASADPPPPSSSQPCSVVVPVQVGAAQVDAERIRVVAVETEVGRVVLVPGRAPRAHPPWSAVAGRHGRPCPSSQCPVVTHGCSWSSSGRRGCQGPGPDQHLVDLLDPGPDRLAFGGTPARRRARSALSSASALSMLGDVRVELLAAAARSRRRGPASARTAGR